MKRSEMYLNAIDILQGGRSVEIIGEHGNGRSQLLRKIRDHFGTLGWRTLEVGGIASFARVPLGALSIAGFGGSADSKSSENRTPPMLAAFDALSARVTPGRTIFVIDDADSLDEASWGVVSTVSSKLDVPFVATRVRNGMRHNSPLVTNGFAAVYSLDLSPMSYAELEETLGQNFGLRFDEPTMSRVFAMSGGNVGLASSVIDAGQRSGQLTVTDGLAHANGSLWSPALRAVVQSILHCLTDDELAALKAIAMLGATEVASVARVVSREQLVALEERAFISIVEVYERQLVTLNPPIIEDYFRHGASSAQQELLLAKLGADPDPIPPLLTRARQTQERAAYLRLVQERTAIRTLRAREQWALHPTLTNASRLMLVMQTDPGCSQEEMRTVIAEAASLGGSNEERAEWALAYSAHVAYDLGDFAGAIDLLRAEAERNETKKIRLEAQTVLLATCFLDVQPDEPFADVDRLSLNPHTNDVVTLARALWFLVRGDAALAQKELGLYSAQQGSDPRFDAVQIYTALALGERDGALAAANAGLEAAQSELDSRRIRMYSFLRATALLTLRRYDEAEQTVADAIGFGLLAGENPLSRVGLTILSAYFANRRGHSALARDLQADLAKGGPVDGALPLLHHAFLAVRLTADYDLEAAARVARETGDEMWERGARFMAAWTYLDGMRFMPDRESWEHAKARIAQVNSPSIQASAQFVDALIATDVNTVTEELARLEREGDSASTKRFVESVLGVLRAAGHDADAELINVLQARAGEFDASLSPQAHGTGNKLSAREREVAELVAAGLSNPRIAEALVVSIRTVESHVTRLMKKLGATRRQDIREYLLAADAGQ
ncbi:hypothetical protein ICL81_02725 [Leucobacter sp. cx-328]|uniref:helix-turn-helix transcriptional regulator n=1 Tax=unclassified Leucobacter TaxID=2621730 RepID=UPI00165EB3AE|nr:MULTISPECIES: LuxR C-terminal-related transcriptional regulator [unclassified Leucobacter]MBC9943444.1 hypothetical protein [Leucobacter sp. cx-328]